jgi:hypothetical protein
MDLAVQLVSYIIEKNAFKSILNQFREDCKVNFHKKIYIEPKFPFKTIKPILTITLASTQAAFLLPLKRFENKILCTNGFLSV